MEVTIKIQLAINGKFYATGALVLINVAMAWSRKANAPGQSHLHVTPSSKIHVRRFSQNGDGYGYLVVITGSTWLLWDVCGNRILSAIYIL